MRTPQLIVACGLALTVTMLAACTGDDGEASTTTSTVAVTTTTVAPRANDGELFIGALLPRTGEGAALGEPMINAVNAAVGEINAAGGVLGQDLRIEVVDENSGTGLEELLLAGVDAIVGPASSNVALSRLGEATPADTGVVTCSPSATALALDDFPDNKLFFRTVPSDSLQMVALERRAESTGRAQQVAVGYLDDPYGRALSEAFADEVDARQAATSINLQVSVPFEADQQDLRPVALDLLAANPGVIVVLGDADDGSRLLSALDTATSGVAVLPEVIVNDAIRTSRQAIQALSPEFRQKVQGVAPMATSELRPGPSEFYTANAMDCVNLIALSAVQAGSDDPNEIQKNMASVSVGGRGCTSFADCVEQLGKGLGIDYNGLSGEVELSTTTGDLVRARFESFRFDEDGVDYQVDEPFFVP